MGKVIYLVKGKVRIRTAKGERNRVLSMKTDEYRKKMSLSKKGKDPINRVNLYTEELNKRRSEKLKGIKRPKGKDAPNWKGGYENNLRIHRQRRVMKMGNGGTHNLGDWETLKAQYNWTCPCCKKSEPEIKLTEDHIIPLIKGGSDNIENIQPLCKSCNCRKSRKIIKYEP